MTKSPPLYTLPIKERPPGYGPWWSKVIFPIVFNLGILGINSAQFVLLLLLLIPGELGRKLYRRGIDWTKDGFGRLLIAITVLCAPTSLVITTDAPPSLSNLVERDAAGDVVRVNLPEHLVIMANHQAYTDWMYLWMLACYCGHAEGITILLKAALRDIPIVGWGMRFFRFIFLKRSWAADKDNLARSLTRLGKDAESGSGAPLWLLIFPEGTITSDDERAKSVKYAMAQGVDDFKGVLHPRSTGLLFCLRTLLPSVPDLQLLDVTISYPGVPYGKYPQEWYSLPSVFFRCVPPPVVRIHLHLYSNLSSPSSEVPSIRTDPARPQEVATPEEARAFELWLRQVWAEKDVRLERLSREEPGRPADVKFDVVPIRQLRWTDWVGAFGGGGMGLIAATAYIARHIRSEILHL